ncbi:MAG: SDR family oxidoreductase [Acidobacteria bacterium]|jgi:nucleoside-diphosphate-sugar epimerase|nr:SDR family oxidoreductase [Acidobacteriota bacterium]
MRKSLQELKEKRNNKESVFLVTGGTGFLGSHITIGLLKKGFKIIMLCRPMKNLSAQGRVERLFDWFMPGDKTLIDRLEIIEGYIDKPHLGLTGEIYHRLSSTVSEIVHCAACTSFSSLKKTELERTNLRSLENLFEFITQEKNQCYYLHHISTAYTAGKKNGICKEILTPADEFHNVYEETKFRGEQYAWEMFPAQGIRVNIYRPSIVYGHSRTGRTFRFNALYYPLKVLYFLKNTFMKDITEKNGEKSKKMGVQLEIDDSIYLPIRLEKVHGGGIDLVPVDFFSDAFMAIMEESLDSDIFHLTSGAATELEEIIAYTVKFFHVKGLQPVLKDDFAREPANALEILFNNYLDLYNPYIRDKRRFDNTKTTAILQKRNITCPPFDYPTFARCMDYAVAVDWGKKLDL